MYKKEEFQAFVEREGVMDFILTEKYEDISGTEIGIFDLKNDRYGCIFKIHPPTFIGRGTETKLATFFRTQLPGKSSIQIFSAASRNLNEYIQSYENLHSNPGNVGKQDILLEMAENVREWIKDHGNISIFPRGIDMRLRNFVNLVCITIPKQDKTGRLFNKSEIVSFFVSASSALGTFYPKKVSRTDYIKIMREFLVPDMPLWDPPSDSLSTLYSQVVDADSVLVLEEETKTIGLGKMISEKEYRNLMKEDNLEGIDDINYSQDFITKLKRSFSNVFGQKKEKEDRKAFTKWHAKVFTTKQYPSRVDAYKMISKFFDYMGTQIEPGVPCQFYATLTIYLEDREEIKKEVFEKTQWNLWQTNSIGPMIRFFPEIRDRTIESEHINEFLNDGEVPMYAMWSFSLVDKSINKLTQYGERVKQSFMEDNWILQEEVLIPHIIYLYSLPLQFDPFVLKDFSKRLNTLFTSNCAAISPLVTGEKGFGDPIVMMIDRANQLFGIDIFSGKTNYNFVVIGPPGSGKSYTVSYILAQYLMNGAKIRVIDVGRSYKKFCDAVEGQYIEFTPESNICLNPFTNIGVDKETGKIDEDELETLVPLVALMMMQSVAPEDGDGNINIPVLKGYISQAITMAFESKNRNAGIQDIYIAFENIKRERHSNGEEHDPLLSNLIQAIYPFGHIDGEYYKYFNGENNLKFNSDFVVIELEELDSREHLKSVVLASVAHIINNEFLISGDITTPKILLTDEAWSIMDNKSLMRFFENMARRIRKYNGASGMITQTLLDFNKNKATKAIYDSSNFKFFLPQDPESLEKAISSGETGMSEGTAMLLKTVQSRTPYFSEIMIRSSGMSIIGRIITDKVSHWIYTTHPKQKIELQRISEKFNVSDSHAALIKGYSEKNQSSLDIEYQRLLSEGKITIKREKLKDLNKISEDIVNF